LSPSAARTLLQRGIRLNADSVDMWREYVKMELGFIEGLRRRWDILGIGIVQDGKGKEKALELPMDLDGNDSMVEQMQVDDDVPGNDEDKTQQAVMDGAIVKSVLSSAAKGESLVPCARVTLCRPDSFYLTMSFL
jgi:U3 small nucleolar RNA-associated protein 6